MVRVVIEPNDHRYQKPKHSDSKIMEVDRLVTIFRRKKRMSCLQFVRSPTRCANRWDQCRQATVTTDPSSAKTR